MLQKQGCQENLIDFIIKHDLGVKKPGDDKEHSCKKIINTLK